MKVDLWPVDGMPPPTTPSRWRRFIERYLPMVVVYLMVATLVAIVYRLAENQDVIFYLSANRPV